MEIDQNLETIIPKVLQNPRGGLCHTVGGGHQQGWEGNSASEALSLLGVFAEATYKGDHCSEIFL